MESVRKSAGVLAIVIAACTPFASSSSEPNGSGDGGDDAGAVSLDASGIVDADAAPLVDAAVCSPERCNGRRNCRSYDFEAENCPTDWEQAGDLENNVLMDCVTGKLRVAAGGTLDITASLPLQPLPESTRGRISMLVAADNWDGGPFVRLFHGDTPIVELWARMHADKVVYRWCADEECTQGETFEAARREERLVTIELSLVPPTISLSVDCTRLGSRQATMELLSTDTKLVFGHNDASPIDGTLDDVVVSFE